MGRAAIGDDNTSQMISTAPVLWSIAELQAKYPCYVAVPQISTELKQQNMGMTLSKGVRDWHIMANVEHRELYQQLVHDYPNIDATRVYLVGHSLGAGEVYSSIALDPDLYAGALASDAPGNTSKYASIFVEHHVKLMIFCGGNHDPVAPAGGLAMADKSISLAVR